MHTPRETRWTRDARVLNRELKATDVFEPQTETCSEHFAYQDSGLSARFLKLIVSTSEKILDTINVICDSVKTC